MARLTTYMSSNLTVWRGKAERAAKALAKLREATQSAVVHARHDGETIAGGAVAGAIRGAFEGTGKDYAIPVGGGMTIPPEMVAGSLALAVAFSGQTDASADFHAFGSGILAFGSGHMAYEWFKARKAAAASAGNGSK